MLSTLIISFNKLISNFFDFKAKSVENKATLEVIEEKKDYKKATNITEKIINICTKYKKVMTFADRLKFSHLVQDFQKHN